MFYRYACPSCGKSLEDHPPLPIKKQWYEILSHKTMRCHCCGARLQKRFAHFDGLLGMGLMVMLGVSGFIAIGRITKYVIPFVGIVLLVRWLAGSIFSVYVLKK